MRKKLFTFLLAIVASLGTLFAWDYERVLIDDVYYNLDATTQTAEVTYEKIDLLYGAYSSLPRVLIIPSSVIYNGNEYTITTIGSLAFARCSFDSVSIPNTVKTVKTQAFYKCSLINITIPQSVESIEVYAFEGIINVNYSGNATGSPWGAKIVNGYFDGAFVFNDKTQTILYAWKEDPLQKDISIPNTVKTIRDRVFQYCHYIETITLPNGLESIGEYAFCGCDRLKSLSVPNSVTNIDIWAFEDVFNISYTGTASGAPWGAKSMNGYVEFPLVFNNLDKDTLVSCYQYAEGHIAIPNAVSVIDNEAFSSCRYITSVTIPNSVTSIGNYAFEYCTGLTSVTIPNSVTSIGYRAFSGCSSLTSVTIPNSVTSIGGDAFSMVLNVVYSGSATGSPWGACSINGYVDGYLVFADETKTVLKACSPKAEGAIVIPNSVTSIGGGAFEGCRGLTSVTIPNSVTSIGDSAFYGCSKLTSIIIPNSVTSIGNSAFFGCSGLTSVTIPNSVTSIGNSAFRGCSSLTSIIIPNSVTSIESKAFYGCSNLNIIYSVPATRPTISSDTFKRIASDAVVYVSNDAVSNYKSSSSSNYWASMNIIGMVFFSVDKSETATSVTLTTTAALWEITGSYIVSIGIEGGEQQPGNVLEFTGLEPNTEYNDYHVVLTSNTGETNTVNVSFTTTALELTTKPSRTVSATTAILLAETNMSDAEVSCGFEYKRNDAPDDMAGTKVFCPVASGQMAGRLKGLKDDVYYKYRAFYQSSAGNMYYGDWQYIFTGDNAIEFDPILYTYTASVVKEDEATLSGYALAGSEDFTEQGFEYWAETRANGGTNAPRRMPVALNEHFFVQASGIALRVTLTNLDAGTVYKYRVYGKVGDQYYYGSEQTFTTTGTYTPPTYTITFANWDGTELQSSQVEEGTLPEYTGATPERPENEQYTYSFNGWAPTIVIASADATYTATYTATPKSQGIEDVLSDQVQCTRVIRNGQIYIIRGDKTYTLQGQEVK